MEKLSFLITKMWLKALKKANKLTVSFVLSNPINNLQSSSSFTTLLDPKGLSINLRVTAVFSRVL